MRERRNVIFSKKLDNVLYELMPMTNSDMVYVDCHYSETLTERLWDIGELLSRDRSQISNLQDAFDEVLEGAPSTFNTFKEVWDYVNINGDPKSALIQLIDSKVDKEEGKGLSTHDLTDVLYAKLVNDYTKEELVEKFTIIDNSINDINTRMNNRFTVIENILNDHEQRINFLEHQGEDLVNEEAVQNNRLDTIEEAPNAYTTEAPDEIPEKATDQSFFYYVVSKDEVASATI